MTALNSLADQINQLLPQTQCTKCGYQGCKPYAEAIASGAAEINQCPPGGELGIQRLAALLNKPVLALNPVNGIAQIQRLTAVIEEAVCIGCTLCIQACPVDAIVGANQLMHTVITSACTGCDLCLPPCPVDCITIEPLAAALPDWSQRRIEADTLRTRYESRELRLQRDIADKAQSRELKKAAMIARAKSADPSEAPRINTAYDPVAAALARVQAKRAAEASADAPPKKH
ncbi:RnfABCDGE type electron transport complex subunit B [Stenotrophobium rhamnosiphilum]|uniref:Ferredoxin n=1 Tax=Stenotrophobium rhamnosiphilum TaxID=2029166 RepID=A0A2T5MKF4_9GAMM|nr:ferredoxin [Stenotrophobium rhamnosiphilum]